MGKKKARQRRKQRRQRSTRQEDYWGEQEDYWDEQEEDGWDEQPSEEDLHNFFQNMFQHMNHSRARPNNSAICEQINRMVRLFVANLFPTKGSFNSTFEQNNASQNHNTPQHNAHTHAASPPPPEQNKDPFAVLELDRQTVIANKDSAAVTKAWKLQARKWHPDKNRDNIEVSENKMKEINAAKNACLGILDGSLDDDCKPKPKNKWEVPSDEDSSDDSDYYNENKTHHKKRQTRQAQQREQDRERQKKEKKKYYDARKKVQRDVEKARTRAKLHRKESKMNKKTRDKRRRQRKSKGQEATPPIWKQALNERKEKQDMQDFKDMFDAAEEQETKKNNNNNSTTNDPNDPNDTNKANEKNQNQKDNKEGKHRIRLPFEIRSIMENNPHDVAAAIRTGSDGILYELLSFTYREQLFLAGRTTSRLDAQENHVLHYVAYFDSVPCFDLVMQLLGQNWSDIFACENADGETPFDVCKTSNCSNELYNRFATLETTSNTTKDNNKTVIDFRPPLLLLLPCLFVFVVQPMVYGTILGTVPAFSETSSNTTNTTDTPMDYMFLGESQWQGLYYIWTWLFECIIVVSALQHQLMVVQTKNNVLPALENDKQWMLAYYILYVSLWLVEMVGACFSNVFYHFNELSFSYACWCTVVCAGVPLMVLKHSKYGQTGIDVSAMLSGRGFGYRKVGVWEGLKNGVSATWSRNICYIATGCIMFPNQSSGIYDMYINGTVNFAVGIVHEPLQRFCPSWGLAIVRRMVFASAFMLFYAVGFGLLQWCCFVLVWVFCSG